MNRQILQLALPSIISNITVPLLGIIDMAITGHIGSSAYISAIAVGGMLFNIIYWMFAFLRMGTSGLTAQALGARNLTEATSILLRSTAITLTIAALLLLLQTPIRDAALALIAPEADVLAFARSYYNICIWGAPAALLHFTLTGWFVGMQNTRAPMVVAITQNISNILLSLHLVYGMGMKIEGVAWGTVLAQYVGLLISLFLLLRHYYPRLRRYLVRSTVFTRPSIMAFFHLNKYIFLRTLCLITVHFYFVSAGARYGSVILAVNALLMQFFTLYSYFLDGFAYAGEAMVGKAVGAGNQQFYHRIVRRLFLWGAAMALLFTVGYALLGYPALTYLTDNAAVLVTARRYWLWMLLFPLSSMAAFIWDGIYIGSTQPRRMLLSVFGGMIIFLLLDTVLSPILSAHALWLSFVSYLAIRGLLATLIRPSFGNGRG